MTLVMWGSMPNVPRKPRKGFFLILGKRTDKTFCPPHEAPQTLRHLRFNLMSWHGENFMIVLSRTFRPAFNRTLRGGGFNQPCAFHTSHSRRAKVRRERIAVGYSRLLNCVSLAQAHAQIAPVIAQTELPHEHRFFVHFPGLVLVTAALKVQPQSVVFCA